MPPILHKRSYNLLREFMRNDNLSDFYLAGGTALALQLRHRVSVDLDLFSPQGFPANLLDEYDITDVIGKYNNSIEVIIDHTKVFLFKYSYPLQRDYILRHDIRLTDPVDIGFMKLLALQGRTTKKDIIDLYFIDQEIMPLEELLTQFERAYEKHSFNAYQNFKKLFDLDPTTQPDPYLIKNVPWEKAFSLVQKKLNTHIKQLLKID